ncbi:hypothetical protein E4U61_000427 [Claviceps capensis]|nr:hypothetical protein E4U61_000427 [Claviceps capensis]
MDIRQSAYLETRKPQCNGFMETGQEVHRHEFPNPDIYTNTLFSHNEALEVNSSEHRKDVDNLMSEELGQIHVDIPQLLQRLFPRSVDDLDSEKEDLGGRKPFFQEIGRLSMAEKVLQETRKIRPPFLARHSPSVTAVEDPIRDY